MRFKDYYKILELENSKVTTEQIKNAYRKQAKKYHPDVNVGSRVAEERIKDINEAYRVLSNPASKRKYDRTWNYNVGYKQKKIKQKTSGEVAGEFFGMFFGNNEIKEASVTVPEPLLKTTIGKITYLVGVHFNEDSKETMADKIDRMIRRDIQTGTYG